MMNSLTPYTSFPYEGQYAPIALVQEEKTNQFLDKTWKVLKDTVVIVYLDCSPGLGLIALGIAFLPFFSAASIPLIGLGCGMSLTVVSLKLIHQFTYLRTQDLNFLPQHRVIHIALLVGSIYLGIMFPVVGFCVSVGIGAICGLSLQAELIESQRQVDPSAATRILFQC